MVAVDRAAGRFRHLKLYYMIGLPTETETDLHALIELALAIRARFPGRLTVNITPFVPKAHTPFQWAPMASQFTLDAHIAAIQSRLRTAGIDVRAESPAWARIQGALSRGDRQVGEALMRLRRLSQAGWRRACEEAEVEPELYLQARDLEDTLPWDFIASVPSEGRLAREWAQVSIR